MNSTIKVAAIQAKPFEKLDDERNLEHALELLDTLKDKNIDIACFPEYYPWSGEEVLAKKAKELRIFLIAGIIEHISDKKYNTGTLIGPDGEIIGRQRKITVGAMERNGFGIVSGETFEVFETKIGNIGIGVCIDFWGTPDAGKALVDQGADIIFNPSFFFNLRKHWKVGALFSFFYNFVPIVGVDPAKFNYSYNNKTYNGFGGSFILNTPLENPLEMSQHISENQEGFESWMTVLGDEEDILIGDVNLQFFKLVRPAWFGKLGFKRQ